MSKKQSKLRKSCAKPNTVFSPIRADLLDRLAQTCDQLASDETPNLVITQKIAA